MQDEARLYGIDWNGPIPVEGAVEAVVVEPVACPLSQDDYSELCLQVSPTGASNDHGINIFMQTLAYVYSKV
jgi:hypothetical protein